MLYGLTDEALESLRGRFLDAWPRDGRPLLDLLARDLTDEEIHEIASSDYDRAMMPRSHARGHARLAPEQGNHPSGGRSRSARRGVAGQVALCQLFAKGGGRRGKARAMMQRKLVGKGSVTVDAPRDGLWDALLDPAVLKELIHGAESVEMPEPDLYVARLSYGVGTFRSRYVVEIRLSRADKPSSLRLSGHSNGALGRGEAVADVTLTEAGPRSTVIAWYYSGVVSGTVALAGMALLGKAASHFVDRFFVCLSARVRPPVG